MEKINFDNMIKSFFLGLVIGLILQFYGHTDVSLSYRVFTVLASGSIGFVIGFITEWLTSILPISIARARTYFFINNLIAVVITTLIMAVLIMIVGDEAPSRGELLPLLWIVLSMVCVANLFDYTMYRRAQSKLETFKALLKDK